MQTPNTYRAGPDAPTGQVYGSCGTPAVMFKDFNTITNEDWNPAAWSYVFTCKRRDPGIAWAQFFVTNRTASGSFVPDKSSPSGSGVCDRM